LLGLENVWMCVCLCEFVHVDGGGRKHGFVHLKRQRNTPTLSRKVEKHKTTRRSTIQRGGPLQDNAAEECHRWCFARGGGVLLLSVCFSLRLSPMLMSLEIFIVWFIVIFKQGGVSELLFLPREVHVKSCRHKKNLPRATLHQQFRALRLRRGERGRAGLGSARHHPRPPAPRPQWETGGRSGLRLSN